MAVGDVVNAIGTAVSVWQYFIPAVGVECIITGCGVNNLGLSDGVNLGAKATTQGFNAKICITNTNYLGYYGSGDLPFFSGIQIK